MQSNTGPLRDGESFGARYQIIRLLGMGGMGAVYHAHDRELGVTVALKVIRADSALGSGSTDAASDRFKRELLLARQVTHRNVVRIHDLGDVGGVKYLTMPYIEGQDLGSALKTAGRLPPARALQIARQIATGLEAAHDAGVIHRDLKPANIMLEPGDHAVIMDFGIARLSSGDATMTGSISGTPEYMAPEQLLGAADRRTDVYAFGVMLAEMLVGHRQRGAHTTDHAVSPSMARVIDRCIAADANQRYQNVRDLIADLDRIAEGRSPAVTRRRWPWAAAAAVVMAAAALPAMYRYRTTAPVTPVPARPIGVAVVPFANASGDMAMADDASAVAEVVRRALSSDAATRVVPGPHTASLVTSLHVAAESWREARALREVGEIAAAEVVVGGAISLTDGRHLEAAIEWRDGRRKSFRVPMDAADDIIGASIRLATDVGSAIRSGGAPLAPFVPPSRSPAALAAYVVGSERLASAHYADAETAFAAAAAADASFAIAHARLALSRLARDRVMEARDAARAAVAGAGAVAESDRHLVFAIAARVNGDMDRAITEYDAALHAAPHDTALRFELAELLETKGDYERAAGEIARVLEADPRNVNVLYAAGRVAIRRDRSTDALDPLNQALSLAVRLDNPVTKNRALQALGIAYKKLGKLDDARRQYEAALAVSRELRDPRREGASLGELGQIYERQGDDASAIRAYQEAIALYRAEGDRGGVATSLNNLAGLHNERGRTREAQKMFEQVLAIRRERGDEQGEALALNNLSAILVNRGEFTTGRMFGERSLDIRERAKAPTPLADTLSNLQTVAAAQGQYDLAEKYSLRALQLRAEAGEVLGQSIAWALHGDLMGARGRLGSAVQSTERAVTAARTQPERGFWWAEIVGQHGLALARAGRTAEAGAALTEALSRMRALKHNGRIAGILTYQALNALLQGNSAAALAPLEEALRTASAADAPLDRLWAQFYRALAQRDADPAGAARELTAVRAEFERRGMPRAVLECDLQRAHALARRHDDRGAKAMLADALRVSERLGTRDLTALIHFALSQTLARNGDSAGAAAEFRAAQASAQEILRDGAPQLYARADFAPLAASR